MKRRILNKTALPTQATDMVFLPLTECSTTPARYPRRNALSDIFDVIKNYVQTIPNGEEATEAMRQVLATPYKQFIALTIYDENDEVLFERKKVIASDHSTRNSVVACIGAINAANPQVGTDVIYDDIKALTDMYHTVLTLSDDEWTDTVWASVEWLLNDTAGFYHPHELDPQGLSPNHVSDNEEGFFNNDSGL